MELGVTRGLNAETWRSLRQTKTRHDILSRPVSRGQQSRWGASADRKANHSGVTLDPVKQSVIEVKSGHKASSPHTFVSDKLVDRQQQMKAGADAELVQMLCAQRTSSALKQPMQIPAKSTVLRLPSKLNVTSYTPAQHLAPVIEKTSSSKVIAEKQDDDVECEELDEVKAANKHVARAANTINSSSHKEGSGELQGKTGNVFSQCRHGHIQDVKWALQNGVTVDDRDENGNTLLIVACQNNHKKIVKMLVKHGADMNAQNNREHSALHYCFTYGFRPLGEYLIKKGAGFRAPQ